MEKISFNKLHNKRKQFLQKHKSEDHVVVFGNNTILISAPHGVSQVRLGKHKVAEIGSLATALYIKETTNCNFIAKTKNNNDDANFDENSNYKNTIFELIDKQQIKYIIDIHGLSNKRKCDINLGTHLGKNIENSPVIFDKLTSMLAAENFSVSIDQPFMAAHYTIASSTKNLQHQLWTIQIEINCDITNKKENFSRFEKLLNIFTNWIKNFDKFL